MTHEELEYLDELACKMLAPGTKENKSAENGIRYRLYLVKKEHLIKRSFMAIDKVADIENAALVVVGCYNGIKELRLDLEEDLRTTNYKWPVFVAEYKHMISKHASKKSILYNDTAKILRRANKIK